MIRQGLFYAPLYPGTAEAIWRGRNLRFSSGSGPFDAPALYLLHQLKSNTNKERIMLWSFPIEPQGFEGNFFFHNFYIMNILCSRCSKLAVNAGTPAILCGT